MNYQLKDFNRNIPDGDLLEDLKRVATSINTDYLSSRDYNDNGGKYTAGTIGARFGSWNKALIKAGLQLVQQRDVPAIDLFKNLEEVWLKIGKQPVLRDITDSVSKYSRHQYIAKFTTWRNALESFIEYANREGETDQTNQAVSESVVIDEPVFKHKTKRFPSERLKVQVLMRDGNKCRLCGITLTGDSIHFDHIKPWSKGGETVLENIQVLCEAHNLAKGNLDYDPN